jgi:hypothetical protein
VIGGDVPLSPKICITDQSTSIKIEKDDKSLVELEKIRKAKLENIKKPRTVN